MERKKIDQHTQLEEIVMVQEIVGKVETSKESPRFFDTRGYPIRYISRLDAKKTTQDELMLKNEASTKGYHLTYNLTDNSIYEKTKEVGHIIFILAVVLQHYVRYLFILHFFLGAHKLLKHPKMGRKGCYFSEPVNCFV